MAYQNYGNQRQAQNNIAYPDRIYSTYNFVPAPEQVIYPEWADFVSHDRPFQDGLSGEFKIELKNETPLFIKGKSVDAKTNEHHFFKDGSDRLAIPGTSLRGMLRNVLEIATFSKLNPLNDIRFGIRDLKAPHLYNNFMAAIQTRVDNRKQEPLPLVNAGWLTQNANDPHHPYLIEVCDFAKLEYKDLRAIAYQKSADKFNPYQKQSAAQKYNSFPWVINQNHQVKNPEYVSMKVIEYLPVGLNSVKAGKRVSAFGSASLNQGVEKKGRLVFTGQPQTKVPNVDDSNKHHDFFFYEQIDKNTNKPTDRKILISSRQFKDFEFIHADGAEQHKNEIDGNEEWKFWKKRLNQGYKVPVFFTLNAQDKLKSFGLAMMFRFAYELSTIDLLQKTQKNLNAQRQDFAELLFGYSAQDKNQKKHLNLQFLKGRVSVSQANLIDPTPRIDPMISAVFGGPKASYYPNYVQQGKFPGDRPPLNPHQRSTSYLWNSYNEDYSSKLRGWKRYIVRHKAVIHPPLPDKASDKMIVKIHPLGKDHRFEFKIRFHNLREVELGALLWAIEFGGVAQSYHSLGMGKNLGLGRVKLSINKDESYLIPNDENSTVLSVSDYMKRFQSYMSMQTKGNWAGSDTIKELIACATPFPTQTDPEFLEQPKLNNPLNRPKNDFIRFKERGLPLPLHHTDRSYDGHNRDVVMKLSQKNVKEEKTVFDWDALISNQPAGSQNHTVVVDEQVIKVPTLDPLPEKLMVSFVEFAKARDFRKNYDERKAKGKEQKYQDLPVKPVLPSADPRLQKLVIRTEFIKDLVLLLDKIKNSNQSFFFNVQLDTALGEDGQAIIVAYLP